MISLIATETDNAVGYDSANRLRQYQRGVLSSAIIPYRVPAGGTVATPITLPGADQVRTYGLDGLGNWKNTNYTEVGSGGSTTSTAEARQHNYVNEITGVTDTTGGTSTPTAFTYLVNGLLASDGVRAYQYDWNNRLIQVNDVATGNTLATYLYDSLDRRIQKTITDNGGGMGGLTGDIPAGTTDYLYDGRQIIVQCNDGPPQVATQYYFWGKYIDELLFLSVPSSATYRVLSDLLYRSVALVTTANVITEAYDTDAYGNTLCYSGPGTDGDWFTDDDVPTNNPINTTIFTGRQYDPESQIYWYRARYYSPQIGRFLSRDPLANAALTQGPNLYWYVQNNAAIRLDPRGLQSLSGQCCTGLDVACVEAVSTVYELALDAANADEDRQEALQIEIDLGLSWAQDAGSDAVVHGAMNGIGKATGYEIPFLGEGMMATDAISYLLDASLEKQLGARVDADYAAVLAALGISTIFIQYANVAIQNLKACCRKNNIDYSITKCDAYRGDYTLAQATLNSLSIKYRK